jgi:hypothetical protein
VRLRQDLDALTRALLESSDPGWFGSPQIYPRWDPDPKKRGYVLQAGKPAQLLILGRNLWRNPQIFVGSQGTRKYEVLPDMQGLVAQFDEVIPVPTLASGEKDAPRVDLRVVTSDGESVLKKAVALVSSSLPDKQPAFVKITHAWGLAGQDYKFEQDVTLVPRSYHSLILTGKKQGEQESAISTNAEVFASPDSKLTFKLPPKDAPTDLQVDVRLKTSPSTEPGDCLIVAQTF